MNRMFIVYTTCLPKCHYAYAVYYRWVWDEQINTSGPIVYRDHSVFSNKLDAFFETDWSRGDCHLSNKNRSSFWGIQDDSYTSYFMLAKNNWPKIEPVNDVLTNGSFWGPFGRMMLPQKLIKRRPNMRSKLGRNQTLYPKGVFWHSVTSVLFQLGSTTSPSIPSTTRLPSS